MRWLFVSLRRAGRRRTVSFVFALVFCLSPAYWFSVQAIRPPFSGFFPLVMNYRGDDASADARFFVLTRFFHLSHACLSSVQAIRPPFSFSSCRKRKRSPAAKRKRALSVVSPKGPFYLACGRPQVHTGHRLKAYAPLRTLSRLPWRFVQPGGVTVSDRKPACFVLHCVERPETLPYFRDCRDQRPSVRKGTKDL